MKLSRITLALALLPPLAVANPGTQREQALKLSETLITANRDLQQRDQSPVANSVFTRADIERLRPASVQELLTHVPGVQVASYGGRGAVYGLYIRGTSTAQTLILIDGVRVGSATAGGASLQYLTVDQIERVEVLRGARSAIYGADAMGGVVQIFTRRGNGPGLQPYVRLAGGSKSTWERSLGLSGGDAATRYHLSASLEESAGFDRTRDSFASDADHDAYRNRSLAFSLSHSFANGVEAGLNLLDQRGTTEIDNPSGRWDPSVPPFGASVPASNWDRFAVNSSSAYLELQPGADWRSRLELGHSEDKQENFDKLFPGSTVNNSYRDSLNWLNTLTLSDRQTLRLGADYLNDKVRSSNDFTRSNRYNRALFVQHSLQQDGFATELGLRHDDNQQFGHENTANAALTLQLNAQNQLTLGYSEGFRTPTFADLYWPLDFGYSGNPDLKPEKSRNHELLWRSQLGPQTRLEASLFRTDFRDLISFVSDPLTRTSTMENVERARIQGFEASLHHQLFGWRSSLGISLIDPRNRDSGHTLSNRARRTLNLDIDRDVGALSFGASLKAFSNSYGDKGNDITLPGYATLDLRAGWQASSELALDLKLSNVLDKDYSRLVYNYQGENFGYREPRASLMLGVTWTPAL